MSCLVLMCCVSGLFLIWCVFWVLFWCVGLLIIIGLSFRLVFVSWYCWWCLVSCWKWGCVIGWSWFMFMLIMW